EVRQKRSYPIAGSPTAAVASRYSPCSSFSVTPTLAISRWTRSQSGWANTLSCSPRPGNNREYTSSSLRSATSSQSIPASSAASNTALTDFRDMPCEDAIARPDRPSARSWSTSFALIFRTIPDCSFRRVPYTHGGRSVSRVVPNDTTAGPQRRHRYADGLVPGPSISGPQRSEYSPLDNHPVVAKRVALSARVRRQQRLDAFPLLIGQGVLTRRLGSAHLSIIPRTQPHI